MRERVAVYLDRLGAGRLTGLSRLGGGLANGNFRLERSHGPPLALKIWWNRDLDGARLVARISTLIRAAGIPTPAILAGPDGELVREVEGSPWMLQEFVDGGWLKPCAEHLQAIGAALARLHQVELAVPLPAGLAMGFKLIDEVSATAARQPALDRHPFLVQMRREAASIRASLPNDLPLGPLHGDLFPDNVLMQGDRVAAILDFEESCVDVLALDLAMAFVGCGYPDGRPCRDLWTALLEGYQRHRPLQPEEITALPALRRYATLSIATWRFDWFVIRRNDPDQVDRYLEMSSRLERPGGVY